MVSQDSLKLGVNYDKNVPFSICCQIKNRNKLFIPLSNFIDILLTVGTINVYDSLYKLASEEISVPPTICIFLFEALFLS